MDLYEVISAEVLWGDIEDETDLAVILVRANSISEALDVGRDALRMWKPDAGDVTPDMVIRIGTSLIAGEPGYLHGPALTSRWPRPEFPCWQRLRGQRLWCFLGPCPECGYSGYDEGSDLVEGVTWFPKCEYGKGCFSG